MCIAHAQCISRLVAKKVLELGLVNCFSLSTANLQKKNMAKSPSQVDKIVTNLLAPTLELAEKGSVIGYVLANRVSLEQMNAEQAVQKVMTGTGHTDSPQLRQCLQMALGVSRKRENAGGMMPRSSKMPRMHKDVPPTPLCKPDLVTIAL